MTYGFFPKNTMKDLEDIANSLDRPLLNAWIFGTFFLQIAEAYVDLPPVVSAYANNCTHYIWPVLGAKLYGPKGLAAGTALVVGIGATVITEQIPLLKNLTPGLTDIPAVYMGALHGFFIDRYRKRNNLGRYTPKEESE